METEELRCNITGRVQGVLFRDFVRRHARRLGLVGYVRNLSDGSVEIVAQGQHIDLEQLLADAKRGPLFAHVTHVEAKWGVPSQTFEGFTITFQF